MDSGIIVALILGASSIISSFFFGYLPNTKREEQKVKEESLRDEISSLRIANEKKNNQLHQVCKQIISYYHLEALMLDELAKNGINRTTVQKKYRKQIRNAGFEKITMTDGDAEKILQTLL